MTGGARGLFTVRCLDTTTVRHRPVKRKRKRKRKQKQKPKCEQHRTRCNPKNDKELCCGGLACDEVPELGGHHCCRQLFGDCQQDSDCCANTVCTAAGFCELQLERLPG
jgi:hypothetical protein